jgi:MYXO-CTERM domain-containing protein
VNSNPEAERLSADIQRQREQLADTVDALHDKLDVKAQAKHKAADLRDRSTTATGRPRPELIGVALAMALLVGLVVWRRRR